jgi:Co/Zn/Cd efflux system component
MHIHTLQRWKHRHRYNIEDGHGERNTRRVIVLTLSMMIIEITAGYLFGSMALLAHGHPRRSAGHYRLCLLLCPTALG